jgi:hypothetical protein
MDLQVDIIVLKEHNVSIFRVEVKANSAMARYMMNILNPSTSFQFNINHILILEAV